MPKKNGKPYNNELACALCGNPVFAKMLCKRHYSANYYRDRMPIAEPLGARPGPQVCSIDGCEMLTDMRSGLCPRHNGRARRWGLSPEELNGWLAVPECQACGATTGLVLDHDHAHCKRGCKDCIRGILCGGCNSALGFLGESVDRIEGLAAYARAL